jgi:FdhD protein
MATRNYEGEKFMANASQRIVDALTVEEALQININDAPFTVSMRTPGDDVSLVRGLLHSEGVITSPSFNPDVSIKKENENGVVTIVNVNIPTEYLGDGYANSRSLLSVSSCGICGKTELKDLSFIGKTLEDSEKISLEQLQSLFYKMSRVQHNFKASGGAHAAAAFTMEGKLLTSMEDIGRHNAVDKVVGALIAQQKLKEAKLLTVSGRISYEIVVKCFKAQIPILAAVSAPSSLAVDYAKELGITLLAFCRDNRATCYAHPERTKLTNKTKAS